MITDWFDLNIEKVFDNPVFTWGANSDLAKAGDTRKEYLAAVKVADANNIMPLLGFDL